MRIQRKRLLIGITIFLILTNLVLVLADTDSDMSNNGMTVQVDIKDTAELMVNFLPVDFGPTSSQNFISSTENNIEFINATYPLTKNKFLPTISSGLNFSSNIGSLNESNQCPLLKDLYKFSRLSGKDFDRVVGIVPDGWFNLHGAGGVGYSCRGFWHNIKAVLIEDSFRHGAAHELGHTFGDFGGFFFRLGLCDEYDNNTWDIQDSLFTLDFCPNGDSNPNNGQLDNECQGNPNGCPVVTLKRLVPWLNDTQSKDEITLYNFMGSANDEDSRWINKDSYNYLLNRFDNESLLDSIKTILVSGIIYKNNSVIFDDFYTLNETSFINETYSNGNYSITLKVNDSTYYTHQFEPIFKIINIGGETEDTNVTAFAIVLPFADNITQIILQNTTTTLAERNVSENDPVVSFITSFEDQSYDDNFIVSWNGSDIDGDKLTYTILLSDDGGNNFTTLALDIDETNLTIENSLLENNSNFKLKVLVTDSVRTTEDISNSTFSIEPDPAVELISPEDNTRISTNEIIFKYKTFVLNANITNCSLYINGILNLTNSSVIIQGEVMNFSQNLADGEYNWTIECVDSRSFIGETEIRKLKSGLVIPEITNITVYPDIQEFGKNVSINATISSPTEVDLVVLNITNPEGTTYKYYNLTNISFNVWGINNFTDNITGIYNFTFFVNYNGGSSVEESGNFIMVEEIINLTRCMELDRENTVYFLTQDIYAYTTCFMIIANNITLEGQGHSIIGNYSGYGVYIPNKGSVTIKNLTIKYFDRGIYFYAIPSNYVIKLYEINTFGNDGDGIYIQQAENHFLSDIHAINNKGNGIYLASVRAANLTNIEASYNWQNGIDIYSYSVFGSTSFYLVNITTNYHTGDSGVSLRKANNAILENLVSNENIGGEGIYLYESSNSNITNIISNKGTGIKIGYNSFNNFIKGGNVSSVEIASSQTNTFLNMSYIDESVSSGELIRKWYLNVKVNETNGSNVNQANVTGWNVSGAFAFSELTNSNGVIETQELIEYINNAGTKTYYTNYTINVTKTNYENASQSANLTTNLNLVFTLESIILPNDTSKYYHKNSLGEVVAWLGNEGNIVLKGQCYSGGTCDNPGDGSLIFRNESDYNLGFINVTGDLCIIKGDCSDHVANCNSPADGAFIIANSTNYVSYIDGEGDLCLVGGLYQNSNQ